MIDVNSLAGWNKTISFPYRFITIESLNSLIHLFIQSIDSVIKSLVVVPSYP